MARLRSLLLLLLLLLGLLLFVSRVTAQENGATARDDMGAMMAGRYKSELAQVVTAWLGTPERRMRLVAHFGTHVTHVRQGISRWSTSFAPAQSAPTGGGIYGGDDYSAPIGTDDSPWFLGEDRERGSDLVRIAGMAMRVPVVSDMDLRSADMVCSDCDGILGLGAGSPFWMVWRAVSLGAGAVPVGEHVFSGSTQKGREARRDHAPVECVINGPALSTGFDGPLSEPLCAVRGRVFGREYLIDLSFWGTETVVPPFVYWSYVGDRTISSRGTLPTTGTGRQNGTLSPAGGRARRRGHVDWPDLAIDVLAMDGTHSHTVTVRADDVVADAGEGRSMLLLYPDYAGNATGNGTVIRLGRSFLYSLSADVYPGAGRALLYEWRVEKHYGIVTIALIVLLYGMVFRWLLTPSKVKGHVVRHRPARPWLPFAATAAEAWAVELKESCRSSFITKVVIELLTVCMAFGVLCSSPTRGAIGPFTAFDAFMAASVTSLAAFEALVVGAIVWRRVHWFVGRTESRHGTRHNAQMMMRLNVARFACHQTIIMLALWMLALQTRRDSLATLGSLVSGTLACYACVYYLITAACMPLRPLTPCWTVFLVYQACLSTAAMYTAGYYVFSHFIEGVVESGDDALVAIATGTYGLLITAAAAWAAGSIHAGTNRERIRRSLLR